MKSEQRSVRSMLSPILYIQLLGDLQLAIAPSHGLPLKQSVPADLIYGYLWLDHFTC